MIRIEISEEAADTADMVDLLNRIATLVKDGYTSGYGPRWEIIEVDDENDTL